MSLGLLPVHVHGKNLSLRFFAAQVWKENMHDQFCPALERIVAARFAKYTCVLVFS
jgi:hypothetical protein